MLPLEPLETQHFSLYKIKKVTVTGVHTYIECFLCYHLSLYNCLPPRFCVTALPGRLKVWRAMVYTVTHTVTERYRALPETVDRIKGVNVGGSVRGCSVTKAVTLGRAASHFSGTAMPLKGPRMPPETRKGRQPYQLPPVNGKLILGHPRRFQHSLPHNPPAVDYCASNVSEVS